MSKEDKQDLVVERQPQSNFPAIPLIILVIGIYLFFTFFSKDESVVDLIKEIVTVEELAPTQNKPVNKPKDISLLHQTVKTGSIEQVKQQILKNNKAINEVINGMTPIMLAASRGDVEIIDLLFTQGADPNKRGSMKRTALQYAAEKNHIEASKRLLAYGADIDAYDNGRLTPLIMAASRGYTELGLLFVEKGADVNIQHVDGWTALIDATAHGDIKFVNALLIAGADKELKAKNGKKAIDYAKEYGFKNIQKILSE
jgi:uncharacterized protein